MRNCTELSYMLKSRITTLELLKDNGRLFPPFIILEEKNVLINCCIRYIIYNVTIYVYIVLFYFMISFRFSTLFQSDNESLGALFSLL